MNSPTSLRRIARAHLAFESQRWSVANAGHEHQAPATILAERQRQRHASERLAHAHQRLGTLGLAPCSSSLPERQPTAKLDPLPDLTSIATIYSPRRRKVGDGIYTIDVDHAPHPAPGPDGRITFTSPGDLVPIARTIYEHLDVDQEHFVIIACNAASQILGYKVVASGRQADVEVSHALIYRNALLLGATAIIALHNHPSGRPDPSVPDLRLTLQIVNIGALLGIPVVDHLIYTRTPDGQSTCLSIRQHCPRFWPNT